MPDDASRALVSAALAGLLCVAANVCSSGADEDAVSAALDGGTGDVSAGGSAGSSGGSAGATVDASTTDAVADSAPELDSEPTSDGATEAEAGVVCDDAGTDAGGVITSSAVVTDMTLEKFTADCDALGGTVEIHPHCGGANSCKGMSYDTDTLVFTEHTCKGLNTCSGYSCVLCK